jgi:hypothetical protein
MMLPNVVVDYGDHWLQTIGLMLDPKQDARVRQKAWPDRRCDVRGGYIHPGLKMISTMRRQKA